jgi:hypothetical protein
MNWWVTRKGKQPIGPVSTELVLKGIVAGKVPRDVLVCEVGGADWKPITVVSPFAAALAQHHGRDRALAPDQFDEATEHTVVDRDPTRADFGSLGFDDPNETTVVEATRFESSEPPKPE